jgi:alkylation response protein AidB-like acyl-CoA dehydrogenase
MGTLRLCGARVAADAVLVEPPRAGAAWARLLDAGAALCAAEMVGAAAAVHALTVRYAQQRQQFGQPIGRFQGVKHPLAEMHVDIETARSLVYHAAWALDSAPEDVPRAASMAKAYATEAFVRVGVDSLQLHGAIGYTAEYDAQLYFKRSKWARPAFGDANHHYERVAALGGL